jgi:hypothetical protein
MKFEINRATDIFGKVPPCEGAIRDGDEWVIEINTLEDLMALMQVVGFELVLSTKRITIYDTYIE